MLKRSLFVLLFGLLAFPTEGLSQSRKNHAQIDTGLEKNWISPEGDSRLAIQFKIDPHWHIYFINPGDSGLGTQLSLPQESLFEIGKLQYPTPERLNTGTLTNYGYQNEVTLLTRIRLKDSAQGLIKKDHLSTLPLTINLKWLICEEICIPEKTTLTLNIPVKNQPSLPSPITHGIFTAADKTFPKTLKLKKPAITYLTEQNLIVEIEPTLENVLRPVDAIPITPSFIQNPVFPVFSKYQNRYRVQFNRRPNSPKESQNFNLLLLDINGASYHFDSLIQKTGKAPDSELFQVLSTEVPKAVNIDKAPFLKILSMTLFALLGGVLLNLMPCVFPVLSLKALSILRSSNESNKHALRVETGGYTLGILLTFWLLSGTLILFRSQGQNLGWGFQLQNSGFILFLISLFFLMGFNLLGVFEVNIGGIISPLVRSKRIPTAHSNKPFLGAVLTGILAVLIATPCTAPFMGVALGFALSQSAGITFLIFTSLGLGLALPFLLLGFIPNLASVFPKPGAWMQTLKEVLAFPLFATVIWLLWIFSIQAGASGLIRALVLLLLISIGVYFYGKKQRQLLHKTTATVFVILIVILSALTFKSAISQQVIAPEIKQNTAWINFTEARMEESLQQGKTVFIDFTAAWCITCQINKKAVLESKAVMQAFFENDVQLLRADWTQEDPLITDVLSRLGRNGVPVYWVRRPGKPDQILPQILTSSIVINSIKP